MSGKQGRGNAQTIGEAIRSLLNSYHLNARFDEATILASWKDLVGAAIAKRTKKVFIRNKVLYVEFNTPAMKNDFLLHKAKILSLFQERFGEKVIADIIIL
jgi:predicted nucleic acid-binding Zn ribbon protein